MTDLLQLALGVLLLNISLGAYFLTLRTLFPRRVAKVRTVADALPGRSFAVGFVNFLFFGAITLLLLILNDRVSHEGLKVLIGFPALCGLALLGIGISFGLSGMVELVGERLAPAQTAVRRTAWGTLALSLGASLPFVGWFLLLPYAGWLGLGAFIISFFYREPAPPPPQPPVQ